MNTMTLQCPAFYLCTLTLFGWMNCDGVKEDLVFEAFSYGPNTAYSLYMGKDVSPGNRTAKQHFKHPLLNMWEKDIVVHKVTLATIKDSKVAAYVVFNGKGTTKTSWIRQSGILNSSYTDISTSSANYFSVKGYKLSSGTGRRAFYMNKLFQGWCPGDEGWIQMLTGVGNCDYERAPGNKPVTLVSYSPTSKVGVWSESAIADSMRIYIEYEEIPKHASTESVVLVSTETTPITTKSPLQTATTVTAMSVEEPSPLTGIPSTTENPIVSSPRPWSSTNVELPTTPLKEQHNNCSECCVYQESFHSGENLTTIELKKIVQLLKLQLQVNKTNLSSFIRRRTSATDKRPSSTVIGSVIGATTSAIVFGVIVVPDLITLGRYLWKKLNLFR